ncbi:restriction endonuclease [Clostridium beijerinckii]|uniref:restriction endonuclease n=1 Tax=Clostridium beijerinckii TaxID=1520 RepID=UPI0003D2A8AE|nr:restriction endonuclease [Clostridium beijerinckii]ALB44034.1 hypothetical protein X276_01465 [Clostridium beijerinckii NRRL B-598]
MLNKEEIAKHDKLKYERSEKNGIACIPIKITNGENIISFEEFEEDYTTEVNYEDDYFYQLNVNRFGNKLLLEFIKLGDEDGYYKDWSYKKFMETLKSVCDEVNYVYVNNYSLSEDDPFFRAFFISMLIDINEYKNFNQVYFECGDLCRKLINITEDRLKGIWWNPEFETDEMLFCKCFLNQYFRKMNFEDVKFNHGNKEFGKDYVLVTSNLFGGKEYYGVQVKAGKVSGSVNSDIQELINQIKISFDVPYELGDGTKVYMSKVIIVISGHYSENAKEIILSQMERYKLSNIIFISKKELSTIRF